jgi:hypothetical protein
MTTDLHTTLQRQSPNTKELRRYKEMLKLTKTQREVIVGLLLGDGSMQTQNDGRTYRLIHVQGGRKRGVYTSHLFEVFGPWVLTPPKLSPPRSGGGNYERGESWRLLTLSHGNLRFYGKLFYKNGTKRVPKGIGKFLTARGLAYWYMDDGSIKSRQSKGVFFNTQSFTFKEVELLCTVLLSKFRIRASPRRTPSQEKKGAGWQIYISGEWYETFSQLVSPYLLPELTYKLPHPRRKVVQRCKSTHC